MSSKPTAATRYTDDPDDDFASDSQPGARSGGHRSRQLVSDLLGRWYWIALGLVLGGLGTLYYLSKAPPYYTASTSLAITMPGRGAITGSRGQGEEFDTTTVEGLNTITARIVRPELLTKVAARPEVLALRGLIPPPVEWRPEWWLKWTGAKPPPAPSAGETRSIPQNALASMIASWTKVTVRQKTRLLDLSVTHRNPEGAKILADALASEYIAETEQTASDSRANQSTSLLRQSDEISTKLAETNGVLGTYSRALQLHQELEAQEKAYAQLSLRYRPKYPDMVDARGKLEDTKRRFLSELNTAMTSPLDAGYWKSAGTAIDAAKDDPDARLKAARQALLARISVLTAQAKSQETLLQSMSTSRTMGNVDRETSDISIRVDSKAQLPGAPSEPNRNKILATGIGGGLFAGVLLAFLLAKLDNKLHSVSQVESETGLPALAAISHISLSHLDAALASAHKRGRNVTANKLQQEWDPRLLFRPGLSSTNYCEAFRVLRASVSLLGDEAKRRTTLITSSLPGEGKSLIAANLALAAAAQGRKTLLIDLDLRKPRQHRVFGMPRSGAGKPGATDWCSGNATTEQVVITHTGADNLHIILSGTRAPNPGELLSSERLGKLLAQVREIYDIIIVDSAPLLAVPDSRIIASAVDNLCLVVRADYTPKGAVLRALDLLESSGTPSSGLIFNGFVESRRRIGQNHSYGNYRMNRYGKAYQYGYGSYGSYGTYGEDDDDEGESPGPRGKRNSRNKRGRPG